MAADDRPADERPSTAARGAGERANAADAVTWQVRVAAAWAWRLLVLGLALYILGRIFDRLELVAVSFVLALFLTAILHPLERLFHRLVPSPKSVSSALALLVGIAALGGIGWFVVWQITDHSAQLGDQINSFVDRTRNWLQTGPLHLKSADLDKLADNITNAVKDHQDQLITGAIATVRTVVEALAAFLLILLSTFFLLRDGDEIWAWVVRLFPRAAHERLDRAGRIGWRTFGGYMRGQLLIALFHGVAVTIVLLVVNVPLAAALGVLIFLGSFIPLVGLTVAGALCTAVALLEHGPGAAIAVAVAIIVLVQVESHLLQPFIMSRSVEVHPLAIALAVITGTTLAGIPGALLSVPFVAFLNSTVRALRDEPVNQPDGEDFPVQETGAGDAESAEPKTGDAKNREPETGEPETEGSAAERVEEES